MSVNDGSNGIHVLIVFSESWLAEGNDYISPFVTTMFSGKSPSEYENENARSDKNILQAIKNVRQGNVKADPGYDGQYGKINVLSAETIQSKQKKLF